MGMTINVHKRVSEMGRVCGYGRFRILRRQDQNAQEIRIAMFRNENQSTQKITIRNSEIRIRILRK